MLRYTKIIMLKIYNKRQQKLDKWKYKVTAWREEQFSSEIKGFICKEEDWYLGNQQFSTSLFPKKQ